MLNKAMFRLSILTIENTNNSYKDIEVVIVIVNIKLRLFMLIILRPEYLNQLKSLEVIKIQMTLSSEE